jgi:DNA-binding protein Fis
VPIRLPEAGLNMKTVEITLLRQALEQAQGNKTRAAELLGLTRHPLLYRLEKSGLDS